MYVLFDKAGGEDAKIKRLFHGNISVLFISRSWIPYPSQLFLSYCIYSLSIPTFNCSLNYIDLCFLSLALCVYICVLQFTPIVRHPHIIMN